MSKNLFVSVASGIVCFALGVVQSGCGSSSSSTSTTPPTSRTSITLSAGSGGSAPTINAGQNVTILAVVANASGNSSVKWSLSGPGSLGSKTPTSVVYSAPGAVSATTIATVTATSVANSSDTGSIKIAVSPGPVLPITVSVGTTGANNNPASTVVDSPLSITATVKNDSKSAGVRWSLTGPGSLTNGTTMSVTYNTPANVLPNVKIPTPTVTATSITDTSVSASIALDLLPLLGFCNDGPGSSAQCNLPAAVFTQPYTATVQTGGGIPPYHWTGILPASLSISSGGVISGTVLYTEQEAEVGFVNLGLTVTDSTTPTANVGNANFLLPVSLPTVLTILTPSLREGSVGASYNQTLLATAGTPPYNWSISGGTLPPGLSINSSTSAITGTPTTTGTYNFIVEVKDSATPFAGTYKSNFTITIQPQLAFVTTTLPSGSVGAAYAQTLQVSGGVPPYSFSLQNGGALPAGLSLFSEIAGVPTTIGASNFTVVASDSQGAATTGNLSIAVTAANCPNNSTLHGNYAFLLGGPSVSSTPFFFVQQYVGSVVADGAGNITQGQVDSGYGISSGFGTATLTGTYCIGANGIGTVELTGLPGLSSSSSPVTTTFAIAMESSGNGDAIVYQNRSSQMDDLGEPYFSGPVLKQDTTAFNTTKIAGNYALASQGGTSAHAGSFTADGAGNLSNGALDGTGLDAGASFTANDLVVATTGRGSVSLNVSGLGTVTVIFYVVNSSELLTLESDPGINATGLLLAGEITQQSSSSYTNASLNGTSVVGEQWTDSSGLPAVEAGLITWDGNGSFTWTADQNDAGQMNTPSHSGTYRVAANGRVTVNVSGQLSSPILYLTGQNLGYLVGTDPSATTGMFFNQSGGPFSAASFSGNYFGGNWQVSNANVNLEADALASDGVANVTGTSDTDDFESYPYGPASSPVEGSYAVSSTGRGTITQNGNTTNIFYVISPTQILMMSSENPNPDIVSLSH